ncbi:MAG TPA: hypothetical protein VGG25_06880 [Streptosporangiaceae bacterium]|jgi:hypothetical protein
MLVLPVSLDAPRVLARALVTAPRPAGKWAPGSVATLAEIP